MHLEQQPAEFLRRPRRQPSAALPPDFAEARKLMQQGKVDEAIAELQSIEARDPAAKGLALEIGTAYYKKSDFPRQSII